ncbi:MAG: DUF4402 domain-containing protein [SAR324 cluster bacterium]|nr:DUF4402 domain-containing protein [SAR324 cluster bacterium]
MNISKYWYIKKNSMIFIIVTFFLFFVSFPQLSLATNELFSVNMEILPVLKINQDEILSFTINPEEMIKAETLTETGGITSKPKRSFTIEPDQEGAARLSINGEKNTLIRAIVVETEVSLFNANGGHNVKINQFTLGGGLGHDGQGVISSSKTSISTSIGATAEFTDTPADGQYSGSLTLRILYN